MQLPAIMLCATLGVQSAGSHCKQACQQQLAIVHFLQLSWGLIILIAIGSFICNGPETVWQSSLLRSLAAAPFKPPANLLGPQTWPGTPCCSAARCFSLPKVFCYWRMLLSGAMLVAIVMCAAFVSL